MKTDLVIKSKILDYKDSIYLVKMICGDYSYYLIKTPWAVYLQPQLQHAKKIFNDQLEDLR